VVMIARPEPAHPPGSGMAHVGPIAVAQTSMRMLQAALGVLVALVGGLAVATLVLFSRVRRLGAEVAEVEERKA